MNKFIDFINRNVLQHVDANIIRYRYLDSLLHNRLVLDRAEFVVSIAPECAPDLLKVWGVSCSENAQDLFALCALNIKRDGYFVDIGAANGIEGSNTYLLEKHFGWRGILVEPAVCWHRSLEMNRCSPIEKDCVWKTSSTRIKFNEIKDPMLSTLDVYSRADGHANSKKKEQNTML
jgi:hypothetical protein